MKIPTLTAIFLFLAASGLFAADERPNILFVVADDQSVPDLGCYGNTVVRTPNFDRFATEGMRINNLFAGAPQCVPARATLLTGISPVAARITRFTSPLPADVPALPDFLKKVGYYTGICRHGHHLEAPEMGPITKAMLVKDDLLTFSRRLDFYKQDPNREDTVPLMNQFFDQAPKGKPWLLEVNFNDPHWPWKNNDWSAHVDTAKIKVPAYMPDLPGVRTDLTLFYGAVDRMDEEFGRVLDTLQKRGFTDNTLVVFVADHGYAVIRGKGTLYDEGLHVPCLVRWPGKVKPGTTADALLSGEDVTPTFAAAAHAPTYPGITGRSFLDLLLGKSFEPRKYIFAERGVHGKGVFNWETKSNTYDLSRCVRSDRYKLIYNCTPWMEYAPCVDDFTHDPGWIDMQTAHKAGTLSSAFVQIYFTTPRPIYQFYDLKKDPNELNNVSGQPEYAAAEKELRDAMIEKMLIDFDYLPLPAE